jgi:hypothetical protein
MTDHSPETFTAVADLIKLVVDAKACAKRVDELAKLSAETATAQANLETERAAHDRKATADTAELAEREVALRKRQVAVSIAEREVNERAQRYADALPPRYPHDPNLFGTITREPEHG